MAAEANTRVCRDDFVSMTTLMLPLADTVQYDQLSNWAQDSVFYQERNQSEMDQHPP